MMFKSIKILFQPPFNKFHPFRAIYRYFLWKALRVLKIRDYKFKFWKQNYFFINHNSFQSMWLMYNYIVDWEEFLFIHNYLNHDSVVFDIGANMGFYTIWMSRSLDQNGQIHSFEPNLASHKRLSENVSINPITAKCIVNEMAVSSSTGKSSMTIDLDGENHLLTDNNKSASVVDTVRLSDYCNIHQIYKIDFIKIDVEGFELDVLKGGIDLLRQKSIAVIQLELNKSLKNSGVTKDEIIQFVEDKGYKFCYYNCRENILQLASLDSLRENYFIAHNIENINMILQENKLWKEDIMSL